MTEALNNSTAKLNILLYTVVEFVYLYMRHYFDEYVY